MLVALDDTDGPQGGCTTYVAARILDALGPEARAGRPRLVRLRPDNPWKTRGNAALVLDLVDELDAEDVLAQAAPIVQEYARDNEDKGAGLAVFDEPPPKHWYEQGVRHQIDLDRARSALATVPTWTQANGRGLVGCLCAAAWRPEEPTYTRIGYRQPDRRGTPRAIDEDAVRRAEEQDHVFDAYDETNEHALVAPRTSCPVLFGLRAIRPQRLDAMGQAIAGEPLEDAFTFVTNQASDDHLHDACLQGLTATGPPERLEGGHVRLSTRTSEGQDRDVLAFEPTGGLREGLVNVQPGDRLLALGSLKEEGSQVNAEKILHVPRKRTTPPECPGCGGSMRSAGHQAGYRCPRCSTHAAGERVQEEPAWYEADASARRHLARPLALGLAPRVRQAARRLRGAGEPPQRGLAKG